MSLKWFIIKLTFYLLLDQEAESLSLNPSTPTYEGATLLCELLCSHLLKWEQQYLLHSAVMKEKGVNTCGCLMDIISLVFLPCFLFHLSSSARQKISPFLNDRSTMYSWYIFVCTHETYPQIQEMKGVMEPRATPRIWRLNYKGTTFTINISRGI